MAIEGNSLSVFSSYANNVGAITPAAETQTEEVATRPEENSNTTETRTEEKKKEGGCAKVFSMILQVVAAVVAVVGGPKGMAIAAALNAAAKAIAPQEQGSGGSRETVNLAEINRNQNREAEREEEEINQMIRGQYA